MKARLSAQPAPGLVRHNALTREFWPRWFGHDGVRLDPAQLSTLCTILPTHELTEARAPVPYLPMLRVPWLPALAAWSDRDTAR